jgi:hypothetical protein
MLCPFDLDYAYWSGNSSYIGDNLQPLTIHTKSPPKKFRFNFLDLYTTIVLSFTSSFILAESITFDILN